MEQDRAPPVQGDQSELAWQAAAQPRGDRQAHRRDDDPDRSRVRSALDENHYPAGRTVSDADMDTLHLRPAAFHGEWNYALLPRLMLPEA